MTAKKLQRKKDKFFREKLCGGLREDGINEIEGILDGEELKVSKGFCSCQVSMLKYENRWKHTTFTSLR